MPCRATPASYAVSTPWEEDEIGAGELLVERRRLEEDRVGKDDDPSGRAQVEFPADEFHEIGAEEAKFDDVAGDTAADTG